MKISAALLSLALAQDDASQGAQSDGAQSGEKAESYGQEPAAQESYGQESYGEAAPAYAAVDVHVRKAAAVCFKGCPSHSPCFGAGGCQPKACGQQEAYGVEAHYEAEQPNGYRRLQSYGGEEAQQSYGAQSYGEAAPVSYAAPKLSCGCPAGSFDSAHLGVTSNIMLWIAFVLLFLPSFFFICQGYRAIEQVLRNNPQQLAAYQSLQATAYPPLSATGANGTPAQASAILSLARLDAVFFGLPMNAGIVTTIASLAYLVMATGHGFVIKCNGRAFYYARYVDWFFTTPLLLLDVLVVSGTGFSSMALSFMFTFDVLMIAAGLIGELIEDSFRWAFFGFGMLFFIPIIWYLCRADGSDGQMCGATEGALPVQRVAQQVIFMTWFLWMFYPIVWVLCNTGGTAITGASYGHASYGESAEYRMLQGTDFKPAGIISATTEAWIYTVLDILAKSGVGMAITCTSLDYTFLCIEECEERCSNGECATECESNGKCGWNKPYTGTVTAQAGSML
jgi:bacteriorhodopsin